VQLTLILFGKFSNSDKFFLQVGISDRLFLVGGSRDKMVTKWLLWEHAEKLLASISLLQKHSAHQGSFWFQFNNS